MVSVDTTVLADFWFGEEAARTAALQLLAENNEWVSLGLWRYELGSVAAKYIRAGRLSESKAKAALVATEDLLVETVEEIDVLAVWEIAMGSKLSFYDSAYVWLARSRALHLYTRDAQILQAAPNFAKIMPTGI